MTGEGPVIAVGCDGSVPSVCGSRLPDSNRRERRERAGLARRIAGARGGARRALSPEGDSDPIDSRSAASTRSPAARRKADLLIEPETGEVGMLEFREDRSTWSPPAAALGSGGIWSKGQIGSLNLDSA